MTLPRFYDIHLKNHVTTSSQIIAIQVLSQKNIKISSSPTDPFSAMFTATPQAGCHDTRSIPMTACSSPPKSVPMRATPRLARSSGTGNQQPVDFWVKICSWRFFLSILQGVILLLKRCNWFLFCTFWLTYDMFGPRKSWERIASSPLASAALPSKHPRSETGQRNTLRGWRCCEGEDVSNRYQLHGDLMNWMILLDHVWKITTEKAVIVHVCIDVLFHVWISQKKSTDIWDLIYDHHNWSRPLNPGSGVHVRNLDRRKRWHSWDDDLSQLIYSSDGLCCSFMFYLITS